METMIPSGGGRKLLIFIALLDVLSAKVGIGHGHDHQAFIQSETDLRYLVDDEDHAQFAEVGSPDSSTLGSSVRLSVGKNGINSPVSNDGIKVLGSPIKFDPPELDFSDQPIGLPVLRKVRVYNLNAQSSIQMLSISGNTIHFHCSFFADKVIPPSGNTTFDVVFLGREEGIVENTLYIHTSAGSFRFTVKAKGTPNPYRLKPLVGVKLPLNSSYSPMIQLHNPHPVPIQVLEMYSSGGDLHLELPNGETEGSESAWRIPPYQTKSVMKANFVARLESNHTAYIRIKTNTTGAEFLYLPLEVEVTSQPGIYSPQEVIDFGLVPSRSSEPKSVKLLLLNSGSKAIQIQNVITTPVTDAISINFKPTKVQPETLRPKVIAEVAFNPSLVNDEGGPFSGKIVVKSKNSQFKVQIPYRAFMLKGRLFVNESLTHFHLKGDDPYDEQQRLRNLSVTNEFVVPVAVHNLSLAAEAASFFEMTSEFVPVILQPGETKDLITLVLKSEAWQKRILNSYLTIHTNASNLNVALVCFHGKVETFFPGSPTQDVLDFGTLGMAEKRDVYFTVLNKNPIPITLKGWGSNLTGSLVELIGVDEGNETQILERVGFSGLVRKLVIKPGHYMVFRVGILTPSDTEGATNASVFVDTDYHKFNVAFRFRVAKGSLHTVPRELIFDPVFPGKKSELKLKVFSSFGEEMITDSVATVPPDPRFSFKHAVYDGRTVIMPGEKSFVGRVTFDPNAGCNLDSTCYSGFDLNSKMGNQWLAGLNLGPAVKEDLMLVTHLWMRYRKATSPSSSFNITLNLDTNQVRGFLFTARAKLVWPQVSPPVDRLVFPLTQVGNYSFKDITLVNPSEEKVMFHLVPFSSHPDAETVGQYLALLKSGMTSVSVPVFSFTSNFRVSTLQDATYNSPLPGFGGDGLHPDTKGFVLKPGASAKVRIRFAPDDVGHFHSGLFVRNNLTGVEFVQYFGEAVYGELKFGKFKATTTTEAEVLEKSILEFDMKEKHLKGCSQSDVTKRAAHDQPLFTVKRSFKVKNTGLTGFYVKGFSIEGYDCEGFGFKVLNCEPFNLEPNETREIHIAFTPDFTLSRISRVLTMKTTLKHLEALNYTLLASVPSHMLNLCSAVLPRPFWEIYLFWSLNCFMVMLVILIICAAGFESDRLLNAALFTLHFDEQGQLLDLRTVADLVSKELSSNNNQNSASPILRPHQQQPPSTPKPFWMKRVANSVKGAITSALSLLSRPFHRDEPDLVEEDEDTDEKEPNTPEQRKAQPAATSAPHQASTAIKSKGKNKRLNNNTVTRKKSVTSTNDADESSSTTTESSNMDDHIELPKATTKPAPTPKQPAKKVEPQHTSSTSIKKRPPPAKKQNSVEAKKSSPERSTSPAATTSNTNNNSSNTVKIVTKKAVSPPKARVQPSKIVEQVAITKTADEPILATAHEQQQPQEPLQSQQQQPPQKKVTPVGKILPEPKRPENLGATYGPIGAKPCKSSWPDVNLDYHSVLGAGSSTSSSLNNASAADVESSYSNGNSPSKSSRGTPSFMQQLQHNRRQETAQFLAGISPTDWPGFSNEPLSSVASGVILEPSSYIQNLWDNVESPPLLTATPPCYENNSPWGQGIWGQQQQAQQQQQMNNSPYVGGLSLLGSQAQQAFDLPQQEAPASFGGGGGGGNNYSFGAGNNIWGNGDNNDEELNNSRFGNNVDPRMANNHSWSSTLFRNK